MRISVPILGVFLLVSLGVAPTAAQPVERPSEVSVAPGETAEVTIDLNAEGGKLDLFEETIITEDAPLTITSASNTAAIADPSVGDDGRSVTLLYVDLNDPNATVASDTITYTVTVDHDAELGTTVVTEHELIANQTSTYGSMRFEIADNSDNNDSDDSNDSNDSNGSTGAPAADDGSDSGTDDTATDGDTTSDDNTDSNADTSDTGPSSNDQEAAATPVEVAEPGTATDVPSDGATGYAPGETVTVVFTVRNTGAEATAANISITTIPEALTIVDDRTQSLSDRLETLNGGDSIKVPYRVRIAPTAAAGSYELAAELVLRGGDDTLRTATTNVTLSVTDATPSATATDQRSSVSTLVGIFLAGGLVAAGLLAGRHWWRRHDGRI